MYIVSSSQCRSLDLNFSVPVVNCSEQLENEALNPNQASTQLNSFGLVRRKFKEQITAKSLNGETCDNSLHTDLCDAEILRCLKFN